MRVGSTIRIKRTNGTLQEAKIYAIYDNEIGVFWDEVVDFDVVRLAKVVPFDDVELGDFHKFFLYLWKNRNHLPLLIMCVTLVVDIFISFFDPNQVIFCCFFSFN